MNLVNALQALVAVRERHGPRLEEALREQQRLLAEGLASRDEAHRHHAERAALEQRAQDERLTLIAGSFRPAALMALDLAIGELVAKKAQAAQALESAQAAVQEQQAAVALARTDIIRNDERIKRFNERIETLKKERARAEEESADEESEEGAAARLQRRRGAQANP